MKINWKVRIRNKAFWLALIPAILLLVQVVLAPLGYSWDYGVLNQQLAAIINALFAVLSIVGVIADPTTGGVSDSERALGYTVPAAKQAELKDRQKSKLK
jgi:phi LC3 family holin